ncbi:MAG: tyrosine-type recombinase/integrase [Defluviitaleaceae bacterium]|nr:tyrosine-type recombinase/integrase [Defluviitaleaceae bacterium]
MNSRHYSFAGAFADEITEYLKLRDSQGHQHLRERHYFVSLDRYLLTENANKKELPAPVVEGWLRSLPSGMSVNTKIVYISHYSQFAKYLHTVGFEAFVPERPINDKSYMPYVFSEVEMGRLFASADNLSASHPKSGFIKLQFPTLLRILYGCGLRLDEALRLQAGDVDLKTAVMMIRNAKGNKDRLVPMDGSLADVLGKYISLSRKNNDSQDTLLFSTRKGERHSITTMRHWFNRTLEAAGIEKPDLPRYSRNICLHCLRHTTAVHSFRKQDLAGIDMYSAAPLLSTFLGHCDIYGTEKYLHMTAENSTDIIDKTTEYSLGLFPEVPR